MSKYKVLKSRFDEKPQGWSINLTGTERHFRVGDYRVNYNSLTDRFSYTIYSNKEESYGTVRKQTFYGEHKDAETFKSLFLLELRRKNTKIANIL